MKSEVTRFLRDERGAVAVDYLPMVAATIGVGVLVVGGVAIGSQMIGSKTGQTAAEFDAAAIFDHTPVTAPILPPTWGTTTSGSSNPDGPGGFVPGGCQGNPGVSCSGLGDGTNPGQGSDNNNAGDTPGGDGVNNPNNSGNAGGGGDSGDSGNNGTAGSGEDQGDSGGCQGTPGVSCSGLGDGTNPGQGSGNNNAAGTPGGDGVNNPNNSGNTPNAPDPVEPAHISHEFPPRSIPHNWGDWRDTTPWVDLSHLTGGQPASFQVHGDGNPAFSVNGVEQTEGTLQWGAQITMDTPSTPGTSHTAFIEVTVGDTIWTGAYTITREPEPEPDATPPAPPAPVATYVHQRTIPYYWNDTFQDWFNRPASIPASEWNLQPYTVSGDGNPVAHSNEGPWQAEGTMRWNGVSLRFDTPPPGQTYTVVLEFGQHVGVYNFTRASAP